MSGYVYKNGKIYSADPYMGKKDEDYIVTDPVVLKFISKVKEHVAEKKYNDATADKIVQVLCKLKLINVADFSVITSGGGANANRDGLIKEFEEIIGSNERAKEMVKSLISIAKTIGDAAVAAYVFDPDD